MDQRWILKKWSRSNKHWYENSLSAIRGQIIKATIGVATSPRQANKIFELLSLPELWDRAFAKNISDEIKKEIHYHQYKWHIFSYKKKECLEGEAARDAFDILTKNELYVMYQNSPDIVFEYKKAKDVVSANFDSEQDIYIFDKSFKWTYVHTHESMCGPYFYKK
ncbi:hypothetical protein BK142_11975 [Paenibacillus glucanolyticus]|nr:hypothetical protein BK142_11975 [Paenibacillus glucanolyticus]